MKRPSAAKAARAEEVKAEINTAAETPVETANAEESFGEGSYVGTEPPAGFDIKGNKDSMKYHTPESQWYNSTIAEVWFNSTEAAEAAGFVDVNADKA